MYALPVTRWTKKDMGIADVKTRKFLTMHGNFHTGALSTRSIETRIHHTRQDRMMPDCTKTPQEQFNTNGRI